MYWQLLIGFLLIYTAIFVPVRIAFIEQAGLPVIIFELIVDSLFITDLILTFFMAIEKGNNEYET